MKNFLVAFALVGCIVACNTEKRSVADASAPNAPKAECSAEKSGCSDAAKAECTGAKAKSCCPSQAKPQE
ncbi:MAG: hypothetical protein JNL28_15575 [Planctomycetes bacterium]|nr:hypothetical protein [Planctomycetota bacterium]